MNLMFLIACVPAFFFIIITFTIQITESVEVKFIYRYDLGERKDVCFTSTGGDFDVTFADKSKKTIVCCRRTRKRRRPFETVNQGKEKDSGCCYPTDSIYDARSQLPCCNHTKAADAYDGSKNKKCIMRQFEDSVSFVGTRTPACSHSLYKNERKNDGNVRRFYNEFLYTKQDKDDNGFKLTETFCCKLPAINTTDVFKYDSCCEGRAFYDDIRYIDSQKVQGCRVDFG